MLATHPRPVLNLNPVTWVVAVTASAILLGIIGLASWLWVLTGA